MSSPMSESQVAVTRSVQALAKRQEAEPRHAEPWVVALFALVLLTTCAPRVTPTPAPVAPAATNTVQATMTVPATAVPQTLILCTIEPQAVSSFVPSQSGNDLLALFFEEPIAHIGYDWEARLVTHVPSPTSGDVMTRSVPVTNGARYADALGLLRTYTGTETLMLPQLIVTFTLQPDLRWSDGASLTAQDAVLGYHLAQAPESTGRWRDLAERTARFTAVDDLTLRWEGLPGYLDADYPGFLFPPQPSHRWQGQTLSTILNDRTPPATGAFKIVAWEAHREARLIPNEHYAGSPPILQEIIVRFPQYAPESWNALLANGTCDVILPDPAMTTSLQSWARLGEASEAIVWADAAATVLRLDLNLNPLGDEITAGGGDAPSPVENLRVRQALNACLGRARLTRAMPAEALTESAGFIPPDHPRYTAIDPPPYSPYTADQLLDEVGWRDEDGDGIREAHAVSGFTDGEPLSLTLHFPSHTFVIAAHIAADLDTCGIGVDLEPMDPRHLTLPGAEGLLFGRRFEMALVAWQAEIPEVCGIWLSERIPDAHNGWVGENFSGYTSETYDAACKRALQALDPHDQQAALQQAQGELNAALPTLFLAWRPFWFVTRPQVQGIQPDASSYGTIWNITSIRIGEPGSTQP